MTDAAREQAAGLFLAAVHVCEQGLVRAPDVIISDVPFGNGNQLWEWAVADEELGAIASELRPAVAARVRAILRGMLRTDMHSRTDRSPSRTDGGGMGCPS